MEDFGLTHSGEWSMAVNDWSVFSSLALLELSEKGRTLMSFPVFFWPCSGQWVTGVGLGTRWTGTFDGQTTVFGSCDSYNDWRSTFALFLSSYLNPLKIRCSSSFLTFGSCSD
jgi:hypothetical protein